jgi:hypothetical protein
LRADSMRFLLTGASIPFGRRTRRSPWRSATASASAACSRRGSCPSSSSTSDSVSRPSRLRPCFLIRRVCDAPNRLRDHGICRCSGDVLLWFICACLLRCSKLVPVAGAQHARRAGLHRRAGQMEDPQQAARPERDVVLQGEPLARV